MKKNIFIKKYNGQEVLFDEQKLRHALQRAGANELQMEDIVKSIEQSLHEGITTRKIYQLAISQLNKRERSMAARFQLKKAIMELGPTGFPFESFIGELLKQTGYTVQVGIIINGRCVKHEVDVTAEKDNQHFMIECKFHNQQGIVCDVKVPLYVQSRFKDIEEQWKTLHNHETKFHQGWVVTNTRFTTDAIQYGDCAGLNLIGWNYPAKGSLNEIIDSLGLYPITCLTSLSKKEKEQLLGQKIVLCKELCNNEKYLSLLRIEPVRIKSILEEGHRLCDQIIIHGKH